MQTTLEEIIDQINIEFDVVWQIEKMLDCPDVRFN
jgi:hypothetical protein